MVRKPAHYPQTEIAVIGENIKDIREDVSDIKRKLEGDYVTKEEFDPYKKIVQGIITLIITSVFGALVALVINKP